MSLDRVVDLKAPFVILTIISNLPTQIVVSKLPISGIEPLLRSKDLRTNFVTSDTLKPFRCSIWPLNDWSLYIRLSRINLLSLVGQSPRTDLAGLGPSNARESGPTNQNQFNSLIMRILMHLQIYRNKNFPIRLGIGHFAIILSLAFWRHD